MSLGLRIDLQNAEQRISALQSEVARLTVLNDIAVASMKFSKETIDTLKRENAALLLDKDRMDWLESRKTEVHFWNNNGNGKCSFIEDWDAPEASEVLREAPTLREAIDAARTALDAARKEQG